MARHRQSFQEVIHPESTLTPRELECVGLMAEGLNVAAVADLHGTEQATVRRQLSTAYSKIGVDCAVEAVSWWQDRFGDRAKLKALNAKLHAAEHTISMFGDNFRMAVQAEAGRLVGNFITHAPNNN